jgi:hypothetical protein
MDAPCWNPNSLPTGLYAFWAFVVLGVFSHARGVVLLMREARYWLLARSERRRRLKRR